MGDCGCANFGSDLIIKIDDDRYININFYPGCMNCDMPAAIDIQPFDKKGAEDWLLPVPWHKIIELNFDKWEEDIHHIDLFHHDDIVAAAEKISDEEDRNEYDDPILWLSDMPNLIRIAAANAYNRRQQKRKERNKE